MLCLTSKRAAGISTRPGAGAAERELDLQMALGAALFANKSWSHSDIGEPMRAYRSSVGTSGITPVGSRRSAACMSTTWSYSTWRKRSILPRRGCG
jgi:hypothetical protein